MKTKIAIILILTFLLSGCTQIIGPEFKINTCFKDIRVVLKKNGDIEYTSISKNVKYFGPGGIAETKDGEDRK
jgi:hypothetical protein